MKNIETKNKVRVLLKAYTKDEHAMIKAAFSGVVKGYVLPWIRVTLRPVLVKGSECIQFSFYDTKQCIVKNYTGEEYLFEVAKLTAMPFKNIYIETTNGILQIQTSKKGKKLLHEEKKAIIKDTTNLEHNRAKAYILPDNIPSDFLEVVGIMTKEGKVKAERQDKFRQLNGFLKIVDETFLDAEKVIDFTKTVLFGVDCGCGNAYLTFAIYNYCNYIANKPLKLVGIDVNDDLLERHKHKVEALGWDDLTFNKSKIIAYDPPENPDLVLALHACDTATDEALFKAITWGTKIILASPCCHHNMQVQLENGKNDLLPHTPLLRHGVLRERFGDVLTDTFRALILRIMGYQTDVIEFVSTENTNRNLLIKAIKYLEPGDMKFIEEYKTLKEIWHVTPYLETLLGQVFTSYLVTYDVN